MVDWWYSKANKIWLRMLALVVSSVFFFTQVVGASVPDRSFWRERRKTKEKLLASREKPHQSDRRKGLGEKLEEKDVAGEVSSLITPQNLFTVPSQYGTVKEVHTQGSSNKPQGMGNRLIIHIQDAHSSPEAQLNSANILNYLQKGVAKESTLPLLICVEGSSGLVDTTLLSSFPEKKIKDEVASEFLKEGKITGEEYFAIAGGEKAPAVNIYGVEDKRAYEKNLKAFDEGISSGEKVRNYLRKVQEEINPLKARLYNKRLKDLESKIESYQKKRISLTEYSQHLYGFSQGNVGAGLRARLTGKYPNFELFIQASKLEEKIDFSKVDSERSKYIKELSSKLTNDELSNLLVMSLDYRLGKVTSGEYYTYLQSLSSRMGKGIRSQDPRILTELVTSKEGKNEYPNLNLYIKYNKLYDRINQNRLFSEISELEQEVRERLCETEEERKLVKLSRMLGVLQDLVSLKISNEDLAYYHKHRDEITPGIFSDFITAHNVAAERSSANREQSLRFAATKERVVAGFSLRPATLSKFEEFYRIALKRNQALVDNTISRMEEEGVRVAVLIAGGFHTPGITELLRDRSMSYVVVTPRLGEDYSSDLEISPRKKKTDLEKAIAGIVGALRATTQVRDTSVQTYFVVHLEGITKIVSSLKPEKLEKKFDELMKEWQVILANRPELSKVIGKVKFLSVVLSGKGEQIALGVVSGKNGTLPIVFRYDPVRRKASVIYGEEKCKEFIHSGSFDNAELLTEDMMVALGLVQPQNEGKGAADIPLVSEQIPVPEGAGSKRGDSVKRSVSKVLTLPVTFCKDVFSKAAFGNIGKRLHRVKGGLNCEIGKLFDENKDVTEEFTGEKSAGKIKERIEKSIANLQYDNLTFIEKLALFVRTGIRNEKEFDMKKEGLKKLSIFYLDSGKNLFWVNRLRWFGIIFNSLPEGWQSFLSKLVPWAYAAGHYGIGSTRAYISAGFARQADCDQVFEVEFHEALHILVSSHRIALKIARKMGISHGAKELMDKLAEEDRQDARNAVNPEWLEADGGGLGSLEVKLQAAVNGDKNAYQELVSLPKKQLIDYFEANLKDTMDNLPEEMFGRGFGYDVRGNAQPIEGEVVDLTPENLYLVGKLLGTHHAEVGDRVLITGDIRHHTPILRYAMVLGAASVGVNVDYSEDFMTTDGHNLLSAENPENHKFVVQISGSHGVPQKNGFKMKVDFGKGCLEPLYGKRLPELYERRYEFRKDVELARVKEIKGLGKKIIDMLDETLPVVDKEHIVVIDSRAGAAGPFAVESLKRQGFVIVDLDKEGKEKLNSRIHKLWQSGNRKIAVMVNKEPDPDMGAGIWDPLRPEALKTAQELVQLINSQLLEDMPRAVGGVFDGDGDRITTILEDGTPVPAFEMTLFYYQRFLLDPVNQEVLIKLAQAGCKPLKITCDVRANSKLLGLIDRVNGELKGRAGMRGKKDIIEGWYITTGYPPQLDFTSTRLRELDEFVQGNSKLLRDKDFMKKFAHMKKTYFTGEASGHNFFHIYKSYPDRICDCAISGLVNLMNIQETMSKCEAPALGIEESKRGYELVELFYRFPKAYSSEEIRVPVPNKIKIETAHQIGAWMKEKYKAQLKPYTGPIQEGDYLIQRKDEGFITVAGYKIQLKDGKTALVRWSNTDEKLTTMFEGPDLEGLIRIMEEITEKLKTVRGVDVSNLEKEIARLKELQIPEQIPVEESPAQPQPRDDQGRINEKLGKSPAAKFVAMLLSKHLQDLLYNNRPFTFEDLRRGCEEVREKFPILDFAKLPEDPKNDSQSRRDLAVLGRDGVFKTYRDPENKRRKLHKVTETRIVEIYNFLGQILATLLAKEGEEGDTGYSKEQAAAILTILTSEHLKGHLSYDDIDDTYSFEFSDFCEACEEVRRRFPGLGLPDQSEKQHRKTLQSLEEGFHLSGFEGRYDFKDEQLEDVTLYDVMLLENWEILRGHIITCLEQIPWKPTSQKTTTPGKNPKDTKKATPLLVVKNILWGTLAAVALGSFIFLLQQFAPHLLPALLRGEFSFFQILAGIFCGIIPAVFFHELGHWLAIVLTDSIKARRLVWPRIGFRDGKGRLMIGIRRRHDSSVTTGQRLAGPLTGLAAILFAFFSPFSVSVTLGITLTLVSINLSSFLRGDFAGIKALEAIKDKLNMVISIFKNRIEDLVSRETNSLQTARMSWFPSFVPVIFAVILGWASTGLAKDMINIFTPERILAESGNNGPALSVYSILAILPVVGVAFLAGILSSLWVKRLREESDSRLLPCVGACVIIVFYVLSFLISLASPLPFSQLVPRILYLIGVSAGAYIAGCGLFMLKKAPGQSPEDAKSDKDKPTTFADDVLFLIEHFGAENVVVLSDKSGKARVVVVADLQGRVMISTADGPDGLSFGWINKELIASGKKLEHFNPYGGEDRFWIGPEGGQFSIFFKKGVPFDLEHWFTPALIDTEPFEIIGKSKDSVSFQKIAKLTNYSGTKFDIEIGRTVRVLSREEIKKNLKLKDLPGNVKVVAFESDNRITNTGNEAWSKEKGLLSIWILGMFNPSPETTVVIPFNEGDEKKLGQVVNDAYFGKVPADKLVVKDNVLFFSGDGTYRSKIGLSPKRAKPILGSYDAKNNVLTIVQFTKPEDAVDYVNSMWKIQDKPYAGDVVNSYNDGPPEPGKKPLGPFFEMETSSPARELEPNGSLSHTHRTIHFQGSEEDLDKIARQTLGVSLYEIKNAFRGKGSPLQAAKVLIDLREQGITQVSRKEFIETYRKEFSNRTVDYEINGLRRVGLIDPDKGIVRLAEEYRDITEEELDKMNKAAQEIIPKGLDRWRLDDIPTKDISVIKEKLASIVSERKILSAAKSFLDSSDPDKSITNLRILLAQVSDSETLGRIIKGAHDYAVHLYSESILIHLGPGSDASKFEHIERASRDNEAIEDKLEEVISALKDRIQELAQTTGSPTTPMASLRSFVPVIVAVILGWASTGLAKDIIRDIATKHRILAELGNNTPALSVYSILPVLGMAFLAGMVVSYYFKRSGQKDKMMGRTGIDRLLLNVVSWLIIVVSILSFLIILAIPLSFSQSVLLMGQLIVFSLIAYIAGYMLNSSIINWQWKRQEDRIKAKLTLNDIVDEFSPDELEHMIQQIENPTFKGKVTKEKVPVLYELLTRLKKILDGKGVRNNLPEKFQKKNKIGGLLMLKKALGESPEDAEKTKKYRMGRLRRRGLPLVLLGALVAGGLLSVRDSITGTVSDLRASIGTKKQMFILGSIAFATFILARGSNFIAPWVKKWWANRGKAGSDTPSSEQTDTQTPNKSKKGSFRLRSLFWFVLGIVLLTNSDVFGAVGEIVRNGQKAGWGDMLVFLFGVVFIFLSPFIIYDVYVHIKTTKILPKKYPDLYRLFNDVTRKLGLPDNTALLYVTERLIDGHSIAASKAFLSSPLISLWGDIDNYFTDSEITFLILHQLGHYSTMDKEGKIDSVGRLIPFSDFVATRFAECQLKRLGYDDINVLELERIVKEKIRRIKQDACVLQEYLKAIPPASESPIELVFFDFGPITGEEIQLRMSSSLSLLRDLREKGYRVRILTDIDNDVALKHTGLFRLLREGKGDIREYWTTTSGLADRRSWNKMVDEAGLSPDKCLSVSYREDCLGGAREARLKTCQFNPEDVLRSTKDIVSILSSSTGKPPRQSKKGPSRRLRSLLLGGLGISLIINSDLFGAVGEIIKSGQQAGLESSFGFPFGLGLGGVLACAVAVVGVSAMYREVSLAGTGLVEVERVRLPQVLGLEAVRQALVRLFEGGRGFVAAIFRKPSERAELRMSWLGPQKELPELREKELIQLVKQLSEGIGIARIPVEGRAYGVNPAANPWLIWRSPHEEMGREITKIGEFAKSVMEEHENVVVIGRAEPFAKVAADIREKVGYPQVYALESAHSKAIEEIEGKINLEKTLFVVSSPTPGPTREAYKHFYNQLAKLYRSQGILSEEIASKVGKHFVAIAEANTPFAEEAGKKRFPKIFTEEKGVAYSIFSYGGLVPLALAGVNIERFVESGKMGKVMCGKEKLEENPGVKLALFLEEMREVGRQIVLVFPEELKGFGEVWQEQISPLGKEGKQIIVIGKEELAAGGRFGEDAAFIRLKVGKEKESLAIEQLEEAGYPVLEITLRGKEATGALFYVGRFATALRYLMRISPTEKSIESSPAKAVGYRSESIPLAVAASLSLREGEPLSEHKFGPEALGGKITNVVAVDLSTLVEMDLEEEPTHSMLKRTLRVRPKSMGALKVMKNIIDAAKEEDNPRRVSFAFVCDKEGVTEEVIDRMLRDYMSACGLSREDAARIINEKLIIDREALKKVGGIVGISKKKISAEAVFSIITERLLGKTGGNGIKVSIVTDSEDKWQRAKQREIEEKILWVLLSPAGAGEVLSTAAGLVVAIEGKVSKWLIEFIEKKYPGRTKELLPQIRKDGMIILPAAPVDKEYLDGIKAQETIYEIQA